MKMTADKIISELNLVPLPQEGGFFSQTWYTADGTAIYYLVTPASWSSLHRLSIAEIWHFYAGDPLKQLQLFPDGTARRIDFSSNLGSGQKPQLICPANVWQATKLVDGGEWALVGTTMAPPYTEECIEYPDIEELSEKYRQYKNLLKEFS